MDNILRFIFWVKTRLNKCFANVVSIEQETFPFNIPVFAFDGLEGVLEGVEFPLVVEHFFQICQIRHGGAVAAHFVEYVVEDAQQFLIVLLRRLLVARVDVEEDNVRVPCGGRDVDHGLKEGFIVDFIALCEEVDSMTIAYLDILQEVGKDF